MDLIREKEENKSKWRSMVATGLISTVAFLTLLMIVAIYSEVISAPAKVLIVIVACSIFATGLYFAMQGERTIGYYKCPKCNEKFVPSFKDYVFGAHMLSTRKLKCPSCERKNYCKKVMSKED